MVGRTAPASGSPPRAARPFAVARECPGLDDELGPRPARLRLRDAEAAEEVAVEVHDEAGDVLRQAELLAAPPEGLQRLRVEVVRPRTRRTLGTAPPAARSPLWQRTGRRSGSSSGTGPAATRLRSTSTAARSDRSDRSPRRAARPRRALSSGRRRRASGRQRAPRDRRRRGSARGRCRRRDSRPRAAARQ